MKGFMFPLLFLLLYFFMMGFTYEYKSTYDPAQNTKAEVELLVAWVWPIYWPFHLGEMVLEE